MNKLKQYRINNNYSYGKMSKILNISKTHYWQIENNQRKLYYDMSIKIADIFKTKPDQLFYDEVRVRIDI